MSLWSEAQLKYEAMAKWQKLHVALAPYKSRAGEPQDLVDVGKAQTWFGIA